ncbi:DUF3710 domain-containing protein [Rhodococcus hoagii]|nr:DUF3710 domain-containing protein [Prescottella equi]
MYGDRRLRDHRRPHLADSRISIVARDGYVDTVTIRIRDVQVAVNLYAAESDGTVPGYVGSCLRYLSSQNVSPSTIISPSVGEIGGTTPGGTHIRFLTRTGPRWLLRGAVNAPHPIAAEAVLLAQEILTGTKVRAPRHHRPGTVVEFDPTPSWITDLE